MRVFTGISFFAPVAVALALTGCAACTVPASTQAKGGPTPLSGTAAVSESANASVQPTPAATPHIPSEILPNHGMSSSRAKGFGAASEFMK